MCGWEKEATERANQMFEKIQQDESIENQMQDCYKLINTIYDLEQSEALKDMAAYAKSQEGKSG